MTNALPLPCTPMRDCAPRDHDPRATLIATTIASSLAFVVGSIINVALPQMQGAFDAGPAGAQWIVNAYLLPLGAFVLLGGALGDHYGRKLVFQGGLLLFAASCLLAAVAWSFPVLLIARVLEGVGAALIAPTSLAILAEAFSGPARGRAVGTWAGAGAAAGALAPVLGGWIVDVAGWRWAFVTVLPIAAVAFVLAQSGIRESHGAEGDRAPLDLAGAALVSVGLLAAIWGLVALPERGMSPAVLSALAGGAAMILAFVAVEHGKSGRAMVPLTLFRDAAFSGLTLFTFFLYAALGGLMLLLPYMLISDLGYGASAAGLALLPLPVLIGGLSRFTGGALVDRFGTRAMLTVGALLVAAGFGWLTQLPGTGVRYATDLLPGLLALALGMALAVAPLTTAVLSSAGEDRAGVASGVNNAISRIGGLVATALLGLVLAGDLVAGFALAAWVGAALAMLSAGIAWTTVHK
ncbi:MFS transporter [Jannaschia donghaensis]|uniref:Efflux protein A n=1 Tax=Jannaschia donghaensis TaxID=420998 RepID=A0A0M6YFF6_9RHOB|nr:MFS transporter [Jannaschia donghaensis]CTQ48489.1 Efflux protein A [Jannaschia donghaensis]